RAAFAGVAVHADLIDAGLKLLVHRARHRQPGDVALHVGEEHRHADPREAFSQGHQGDRLAGAGRTGDQAVAIAQPRLQKHLAAGFGQRVRRGDGLADEYRGKVGHAGFRNGDCGRFYTESSRRAADCRSRSPATTLQTAFVLPVSMSAYRCCPRVIAAVFASAILLLSPDASALSKRDQTAVDAIDARMDAAEHAYRQALVKIGNADPAG